MDVSKERIYFKHSVTWTWRDTRRLLNNAWTEPCEITTEKMTFVALISQPSRRNNSETASATEIYILRFNILKSRTQISGVFAGTYKRPRPWIALEIMNSESDKFAFKITFGGETMMKIRCPRVLSRDRGRLFCPWGPRLPRGFNLTSLEHKYLYLSPSHPCWLKEEGGQGKAGQEDGRYGGEGGKSRKAGENKGAGKEGKGNERDGKGGRHPWSFQIFWLRPWWGLNFWRWGWSLF